jgi:hypothetical protein
MVIDHVSGYSWLGLLTGGGRFYVSGAEGFVFLAGLVSGLIHSHRIAAAGFGSSLQRLIRRALLVYAVMIGLAPVFIPLSEALLNSATQGPDLGDPLAFAVSFITLRRSYDFLNILLLYTLLLPSIAPVALYLLSRRRTGICLGASWLLWGLYQVWPEQFSFPWPIPNDHFDFSAWQALYVTGIVLGYHRRRVGNFFRRWSHRWLLAGAALTMAMLLALFLLVDIPLSRVDPVGQLAIREILLGRSRLSPGRLIAFVPYFGLLYLLVTLCWTRLIRAVGWFLLPLGQRSLFAYAVHLPMLPVAAFLLQQPYLANWDLRTGSVVVQVAGLTLVWLLVSHAEKLTHARACVARAPRPPNRVASNVSGYAARLIANGLAAMRFGLHPGWRVESHTRPSVERSVKLS